MAAEIGFDQLPFALQLLGTLDKPLVRFCGAFVLRTLFSKHIV